MKDALDRQGGTPRSSERRVVTEVRQHGQECLLTAVEKSA